MLFESSEVFVVKSFQSLFIKLRALIKNYESFLKALRNFFFKSFQSSRKFQTFENFNSLYFLNYFNQVIWTQFEWFATGENLNLLSFNLFCFHIFSFALTFLCFIRLLIHKFNEGKILSGYLSFHFSTQMWHLKSDEVENISFFERIFVRLVFCHLILLFLGGCIRTEIRGLKLKVNGFHERREKFFWFRMMQKFSHSQWKSLINILVLLVRDQF